VPAHEDSLRPMLTYEDALAAVLASAEPLPPEAVPLGEAVGRCLADDVRAPEDQPATALSSRDGYAFATPSDDACYPLRFPLTAEERAGAATFVPLHHGHAARIFTGAPLPAGADTVLMQEDAEFDDGALVVRRPYPAGRFVRPPASDCRRGDVLLRRGTRIEPAHVGLLASIGCTSPSVHRRPVVAYFVNGDELIPAAAPSCPPGKVRDANGPALHALRVEAGAQPVDLGTASDDRPDVRRRMAEAPRCDVLVTVGGASVGDYDHVLMAAAELGYDIGFSRVALKPGKPTIFGVGPPRLIVLTGNPVSCVVVFRLLVRPLLLKLAGAAKYVPATSRALLATDERKEPSRRYFLPGRCEATADGLPHAFPAERRESSALASLAEATVLIVLPEGQSSVRAGTAVTVVHLDHPEVAP